MVGSAPLGDDVPILIVNENDQPVGSASIDTARQQGLIHRIVRVIADDGNNRVLLQKRSDKMQTYPNCWDTSAGGHVDEGETYEIAAKRELSEEVGIGGFEIRELAYYRTSSQYKGLKLERFNKLYKVTIPKATGITIQEQEVTEARWFTIDDVRQLIKDEPDGVSDGLREAIEHYFK